MLKNFLIYSLPVLGRKLFNLGFKKENDMKKEIMYSVAIIAFVIFTVGTMEILKRISSDLTIPFTIIVLTLIGGIAVSWASWDSAKGEGPMKYSVVFGVCAVLLFSFGAFLTFSTFIL